MQGECFGEERGLGLCLWLKIPWFDIFSIFFTTIEQ